MSRYQKNSTNNVVLKGTIAASATSAVQFLTLATLADSVGTTAIGIISFTYAIAALPTTLITAGYERTLLIKLLKTHTQPDRKTYLSELILQRLLAATFLGVFTCAALAVTQATAMPLIVMSELLRTVYPSTYGDSRGLMVTMTISILIEKTIVLIALATLKSSLNIDTISFLISTASIINTIFLMSRLKSVEKLGLTDTSIPSIKIIFLNIVEAAKNSVTSVLQLGFGNNVKLLLGYLGSFETLAIFSVGWQVSSALNLPSSLAVRKSYADAFNQLSSEKIKSRKQLLYLCLRKITNPSFLSICVLLVLCLLSYGKVIALVSLGNESLNKLAFFIPYLPYIAAYYGIGAVCDLVESILYLRLKRKSIIKSLVIGVICANIIALLLLKSMGIYGILVGLALGQLLATFLMSLSPLKSTY